MKKFIPVLFVALMFLAFMAGSLNSFGQDKTNATVMTSMPENISGILKNSCLMCHSSQSNGKAKIFLNLSKWDSMIARKQAKEAKSISKQISKGNMPPAGFLEKRPQAKLTADQVLAISTWAHGLKKKK